MNTFRHILITGNVGVGKSTLVRTLLAALNRPVYGFITLKMPEPGTDKCPIYIFPAGQSIDQRQRSKVNLLAIRGAEYVTCPEVFDALGVEYIRSAKPDGVILMDELGFMEADAKAFQSAVLNALHGDIPVIAAVKNKPGIPFLESVRRCPNTVLYTVTPENRNALPAEIISSEPLFRI